MVCLPSAWQSPLLAQFFCFKSSPRACNQRFAWQSWRLLQTKRAHSVGKWHRLFTNMLQSPSIHLVVSVPEESVCSQRNLWKPKPLWIGLLADIGFQWGYIKSLVSDLISTLSHILTLGYTRGRTGNKQPDKEYDIKEFKRLQFSVLRAKVINLLNARLVSVLNIYCFSR